LLCIISVPMNPTPAERLSSLPQPLVSMAVHRSLNMELQNSVALV